MTAQTSPRKGDAAATAADSWPLFPPAPCAACLSKGRAAVPPASAASTSAGQTERDSTPEGNEGWPKERLAAGTRSRQPALLVALARLPGGSPGHSPPPSPRDPPGPPPKEAPLPAALRNARPPGARAEQEPLKELRVALVSPGPARREVAGKLTGRAEQPPRSPPAGTCAGPQEMQPAAAALALAL